jgi:hypothetical protein
MLNSRHGFARSQLSGANAAIFVSLMAGGGVFILANVLAQTRPGLSPSKSGLALLERSAASGIATPFQAPYPALALVSVATLLPLFFLARSGRRR